MEKAWIWGHQRFGFFIIWFITQLFFFGTEIEYIGLWILGMLLFSAIGATINPQTDMEYDEKGFPKRKKFFTDNLKFYFTVISFFSMLMLFPVSESTIWETFNLKEIFNLN